MAKTYYYVEIITAKDKDIEDLSDLFPYMKSHNTQFYTIYTLKSETPLTSEQAKFLGFHHVILEDIKSWDASEFH